MWKQEVEIIQDNECVHLGKMTGGVFSTHRQEALMRFINIWTTQQHLEHESCSPPDDKKTRENKTHRRRPQNEIICRSISGTRPLCWAAVVITAAALPWWRSQPAATWHDEGAATERGDRRWDGTGGGTEGQRGSQHTHTHTEGQCKQINAQSCQLVCVYVCVCGIVVMAEASRSVNQASTAVPPPPLPLRPGERHQTRTRRLSLSVSLWPAVVD